MKFLDFVNLHHFIEHYEVKKDKEPIWSRKWEIRAKEMVAKTSRNLEEGIEPLLTINGKVFYIDTVQVPTWIYLMNLTKEW